MQVDLGKQRIKLVLAVILIATILGAYAYQQYRSQPIMRVTSTSYIASLISTNPKTSAETLVAPTSELTLNDLLVLKAKYPRLFNPTLTYIEFASIDLSTNPKADGTVIFRNVTVTHNYVSGMLIPNGVQWPLTRGPLNVVVFALADYASQVPTSGSLSNSVKTFLVIPRSGLYPHVYLFLVS